MGIGAEVYRLRAIGVKSAREVRLDTDSAVWGTWSAANRSGEVDVSLTHTEQRFAERSAARRRMFLTVSIVGGVVALALAGYYAGCRIQDPTYPLKGRGALVLLILLNARNNFRQYRLAGVLGKLLPVGGSGGSS